MTKDLPYIDNICHQCSGYHCRDSVRNLHKECDRWKLLNVLQNNGNYDILKFSNDSMFHLAKRILEDIDNEKYEVPAKLIKFAVNVVNKWENYYD